MAPTLNAHADTDEVLDGELPDYNFLEERRRLMALKIETWFETL